MTYYHCRWLECLVKLWQYLQPPNFLFVRGYIIEQRMMVYNRVQQEITLVRTAT